MAKIWQIDITAIGRELVILGSWAGVTGMNSRFKIQDNLLSCKIYIKFAFGHLKVLYMYIQI